MLSPKLIDFPAAILQDRYFSVDRPHYMNYASIGSVIGHEITHGFDDQGRQFDVSNSYVLTWKFVDLFAPSESEFRAISL